MLRQNRSEATTSKVNVKDAQYLYDGLTKKHHISLHLSRTTEVLKYAKTRFRINLLEATISQVKVKNDKFL